jgi:uncharacterized repeat protein (TIGR01451 family)
MLPIVRATPYAIFTAGFNASGQPAISLPLHWSVEGLPIGVQLVAAYGRETSCCVWPPSSRRRGRGRSGGRRFSRPPNGSSLLDKRSRVRKDSRILGEDDRGGGARRCYRRSRWLSRLATGAVLSLGLVAALGRPAGAAPGEDDTPIPNPNLVAACGIDIEVILDRSGSIASAGATEDVRRAFRAFTAALNNTGSRLAVADFSTVARLPLPGAAQRAYTTVTDNTIATIFNPYINGFNPGGRTHWEDGFRVGRYFLPRPSQATPHLVVFITDGDPNQVVREDRVTYDPGNPNLSENEYELKVPLADNEQASADSNPAKDRAVPNANALKAEGSHILTVAVGAGLSSQSSLNRIIDVSGPDVFSGSGTFDISTTDVYRQPDFSQLEAALREAAFQLCAPSVNVRKRLDLDPDPAVDDFHPGQDWEMTATASPTPTSWVLPPGATGATATSSTGPDGFVNFQWNTPGSVTSTVTVTEAVQPGYTNDPSATTCTYTTPDQPTPQPLPGFSATSGGFSGTVPEDAIVTCTMVNRVPPDPSVDIEKSTNGDDADAPTGPFVPIGSPVTWTYRVTNTGNVPLSGITVTDNQGVTVTCPQTTLLPGADMTCTAPDGAGVTGQYENEGTVTATGAGTEVTDTDLSHYFGVAAGIDIEKFTNGADADNAPGPFIPVGDAVTWTYQVTNTGNAPITGAAVTDDVLGAITCPATIDPLDPGEIVTCTAPAGTAVAGQYENTGSVTGTAPTGTVQDSDVSHYFGAEPDVAIQKFTNGEDANTPTGPLAPVGEPVFWRYQVTNTGNVPLVGWQPTDDQGIPVACPRLGLLFPGQTVNCRASGIAEEGQYTNVADVSATTPAIPGGAPVTDSDPSNYFGIQGTIDLEKLTEGEDADEPPGPFIAVGDTVDWIYRVTNTGNSELTDVTVVDANGVALTCPQTTLAAGASMDCTGTGTAEPDQYTNHAAAAGLTPLDDPVFDTDPSHYFGAAPGIHIEKDTNGVDADTAEEAPFIPVGDPVDWTYLVTNTGNDDLSDVTVTDDQGVDVTCPQTTLPVGDEMTCTASGTAALGPYENTGSVTGTDETGAEVVDDDPSHYFGSVSEIRIEKFTNGEDADNPTGPRIPAGGPVTWTYEVTNPGNVRIRHVRVADDKVGNPQFVGGDVDGDGELEPGEVWTYRASGTAAAGQYANTATVTGLDVLENEVSDRDPSHYFTEAITPVFPEPAPEPRPRPRRRPRLVLTKRAEPKRVRAGERVRFRLRIRNVGRGTARRVRVFDRLPSGLVFASVKGARVQGRRACFTMRVLRPRRSRTFVVTVRAMHSERARRICNVAARAAQRVRIRRARACVRVLPRVERRKRVVTG